MERSPQPTGRVYVVGAGPGDPDLITLRGQKLLASADVVFYTGSLVPEQMLQHCRADAEIIDTRDRVLETILPLAIARAQAGLTVVRLQDGDPSLYGALHELMARLLEVNIDFEIVPGVSAFQLAAARLKVELTVPELVQSIILTRTSGRTTVPEAEDLAKLAAHRASLCLYLSARHAANAQTKLLEHYPADTGIALCYRLGWPDEILIRGRLDRMNDLTRTSGFERTVLYVISPALNCWPQSDIPENQQRSRLYSPDHAHLFRPHRSKTPVARN
ncbi:MAG: precorrin-4 C(11)-methyltransferase [Cyanobacteria bacterium J06648_11]